MNVKCIAENCGGTCSLVMSESETILVLNIPRPLYCVTCERCGRVHEKTVSADVCLELNAELAKLNRPQGGGKTS